MFLTDYIIPIMYNIKNSKNYHNLLWLWYWDIIEIFIEISVLIYHIHSPQNPNKLSCWLSDLLGCRAVVCWVNITDLKWQLYCTHLSTLILCTLTKTTNTQKLYVRYHCHDCYQFPLQVVQWLLLLAVFHFYVFF